MKAVARFALAVVALTALLVPLVFDLARRVLLTEILRVAWKVGRLVDSLPQAPFWLAFLFVAALVAALSLLPRPRGAGEPARPARRADGEPRPTVGQVADLALLIRRASVRGARAGWRLYFRRRLVQRLSHLGREVFAHGHGAGPEPRSLFVAPGEGEVDPRHPNAPLHQALAHLRAEPAARRLYAEPGARRADAVPGARHGGVDPAVELFVQFLEEQLEVVDGPFHRSRR